MVSFTDRIGNCEWSLFPAGQLDGIRLPDGNEAAFSGIWLYGEDGFPHTAEMRFSLRGGGEMSFMVPCTPNGDMFARLDIDSAYQAPDNARGSELDDRSCTEAAAAVLGGNNMLEMV